MHQAMALSQQAYYILSQHNDCIVFGKDKEEFLKNLETVFERLKVWNSTQTQEMPIRHDRNRVRRPSF